jgi:hypothetical protein
VEARAAHNGAHALLDDELAQFHERDLAPWRAVFRIDGEPVYPYWNVIMDFRRGNRQSVRASFQRSNLGLAQVNCSERALGLNCPGRFCPYRSIDRFSCKLLS